MTGTIDERALALLQKLIETRKDDGQGISVKVVEKEQAVELAITAKPSSGWKGKFGESGEATPRTVEELEAVAKAAGLKGSEYKVWAEGGKVFFTYPYQRKDEAVFTDLKMGWDKDQKARWAPLKGAAPSP